MNESHQSILSIDLYKNAVQTMQMLKKISYQKLPQSASERINLLKKTAEAKILGSILGAKEYLIQINKSSWRQSVQQILKQREEKVSELIKENKLYISPKKSSRSILQQLHQIQKKENSRDEKIDEFQLYNQQLKQYDQYMEFRRKQYWKQPSDKQMIAKKLIKKLQFQKEKMLSKLEANQKKVIQKQKSIQLKQKNEKQDRYQREKHEIHARFQKMRQQKLLQQQEFQKKQKQIQFYLRRYKMKTPVHVRYAQNFEKDVLLVQIREKEMLYQERKAKKQKQWKEALHIDKSYQKRKQNDRLIAEERVEAKRQEEREQKQRLQQLYHCKFHQLIQNQRQKKKPDKREINKKIQHQKAERRATYSLRISQNFKPTIDNTKRSELSLMIENQHSRKKIQQVDSQGNIILKDQGQFIPRIFGLQYLKQIKKLNQIEGRKKKAHKIILAEQFRPKIIKASQRKKQFARKTSLPQWRNVVENQNIGIRQKIQIMDQIFEKSHQSFEIVDAKQEKIQFLQIQRLKAKLALLKKF